MTTRSRQTDAADVGVKQRLCATLQIGDAAIANEGLCVNTIDRQTLLNELRLAVQQIPPVVSSEDWELVSNRGNTVAALAAVGAVNKLAQSVDRAGFEYLSFSPSKN